MGAAGSSLGGGYSVVYLVAGITAIASAALTLFIPVRTRAERDA